MSADLPKMPEPVACKHIQDCSTPKLCLSVGTCKGYYVMPASVRESAGKTLPEPMSDHEVSAMFQYWHNEHGTTWADLIRRVEKLTFEKAALHYDNVAQEAARQAMERECEWTRDSDFESEVWNTACGNAFIFTDGGPAENDAKFCCYCGGKLRALIPQDPDHLAGVGNMVDGKDQSEERHG